MLYSILRRLAPRDCGMESNLYVMNKDWHWQSSLFLEAVWHTWFGFSRTDLKLSLVAATLPILSDVNKLFGCE